MTRPEQLGQSHSAMAQAALTQRLARDVHENTLQHLQASERLVRVLRSLRSAAEENRA